MSYRMRNYRLRNPKPGEEKKTNTPFFQNPVTPTLQAKQEGPFFQTKLAIGQPGDSYEKEADSVANKVVSQSAKAGPVVQQKEIGSIQRLSTSKEDERFSTNDSRQERDKEEPLKPLQRMHTEGGMDDKEKKGVQMLAVPDMEKDKEKSMRPGMVQRKGNNNQSTSANLSSKLESSAGKGNSMHPHVLSEMSRSFGVDFSKVRVHRDSDAIKMNKDLKAQAFTYGSDIYFNQGKYSPETAEGKFLLAHELTHVVQQGGGSKKINKKEGASGPVPIKEHGDTSKIPPGLACPVSTDTTGSAKESYPFKISSAGLSGPNKILIQGFIDNWYKLGASESVQIDGFASTTGDDTYNWTLSCDRAVAVKKEMTHPSAGGKGIPESFITIFAHGETNHFSTSLAEPNQVAIINSNVPVPPIPPGPGPLPGPGPTPPAEQRVCGPDVTGEVRRIWSQIQTDFGGWSFMEKQSACRYLVQPLIPDPAGGVQKNIDAFDTLGLFLNTALWTRNLPYHPPCCVPGSINPQVASTDPACLKDPSSPGCPRDPENENPNNCSNTVKVGSGCWLSGTANYGTYGVMMSLCHDWVNSPAAVILIPPPLQELLSKAFSVVSMAALIAAYKAFDHEDPTFPLMWALATYGNPGGVPSGSNRPTCDPTCPKPFVGPSFDYVWEPTKTRPGSISAWEHA